MADSSVVLAHHAMLASDLDGYDTRLDECLNIVKLAKKACTKATAATAAAEAFLYGHEAMVRSNLTKKPSEPAWWSICMRRGPYVCELCVRI